MQLLINGLEMAVEVDRPLVDEILLPQLQALARQASTGPRRFVFLAAPPGVGKSTLAAVLKWRSVERHLDLDLDVIGIDGFHHPNSYLATHDVPSEGGARSMVSIKGAPETFDVTALAQHLTDGATRELRWPTYDRTSHDVVASSQAIRAQLVLVEGNWLLLDEPGWRELSTHSAFNIFIDAEPGILRDRLIERKVAGGMNRTSAIDFYENSDRRNVERVLKHTDRRKVDLTLRLNADRTIDRGEAQR